MKTQVTLSQITENLVKVFSNENESRVYNTTSEQYDMFCGWCGTMAPVTRPAYLKTFGADAVEQAEKQARERLAQNANTYETSHHAAHVIEARKHQANGCKAPAAGSFVYAVNTGLKCDDGRGLFGELEAVADRPEWLHAPKLVKVCQVFEVSPEDFARPELADELVQANTQNPADNFPGGAGTDDPDREDITDEYRYYFTLAAAVVCGSRWFLIDSEGYRYARYCLLPTSWREMLADEYAQELARVEARKEAERKEEEREAEERRADYVSRCNKYAGTMEDITPLQEAAEITFKAESEAGHAHGYRSAEYKAAQKKHRATESALTAARKRNLIAMAATIYPGIKCKANKSDRWAGAYDVTYFDGPRLKDFRDATDYDLFMQVRETFDGYTDSTEYIHMEFTEFGAKYMGIKYGDFATAREWSDETRARLIADVLAVVPESADSINTYDSRHKWTREELREIADRTGANCSYIINEFEDYGETRHLQAETVARWCFDTLDLYTAPTTPDKPRKSRKADSSTPTASEGSSAPAEGLQLIETAEGVAVIGNDWKDTYFNKKDIKAHGATWNKERKQWEATDPAAIATLRAWFALRTEEQATAPTLQEAEDITATTLQDSGEIEEPADALPIAASMEEGAPVTESEQNRPACFEDVAFYNIKGVTDEHGHRIKTAEEISQQARRIECNYIACRGGLRDIARRLERTKGEHHPDTVAAYKRLQSRAAWLRRAELNAHKAMGEARRAAYYRAIDTEREEVGRLERHLAMGESIDRDECQRIADYHKKHGGHIPAKVIECLKNGWQFTETLREVTNPIKADDLHTPRVYQLSERRYIVKHISREQAEELVSMGGRYTIEGVIFAASKANRDALHIWQNKQNRKERAEILGEGWQYAGDLRETARAEVGDLITCIDGTTGVCTKSHPESCVIEFKDDKTGRALSVAGYFFRPANYSASEKLEPVTEADNSPSWETSYTADDFRKLTTAGEIADEDRDIIGRRFVHSMGAEGDVLEVFIADYAGNERHALVYSLEPLFEEVRCKVRSLDYLRKLYTPAHGWQAA